MDRGKDAEALARFKTKVSGANHRGQFKSPEHLQYQVVRDIIGLFDDLGGGRLSRTTQNRTRQNPKATIGESSCVHGTHRREYLTSANDCGR